MPKISISNLGPIKEIKNLEIKDLMVFIGPSASGKSTLAKAIYFFHSAWEVLAQRVYKFFEEALEDSLGSPRKETKHFTGIEKQIFHYLKIYLGQIFDPSISYVGEVSFETNSGKIILVGAGAAQIEGNQQLKHEVQRITAHVNEDLLSRYKSYPELYGASGKQKARLDFLHYLRREFLRFFELPESLVYDFVPGTRILIGQDLSWRNQLQPGSRTFDFLSNTFINEIEEIKSKLNGQAFKHLLEANEHFSSKTQEILKGKLLIDPYDGQIKINISDSETRPYLIPISSASSGQQFATGLFLPLIANFGKRKVWEAMESDNLAAHALFIEEPEAHLFPSDQKNMVEALAYAFNQGNYSPMVITTHSPYFLSELNNLIYAGRKGTENGLKEEISELIPKDFWIDPKRYGAYMLGNGIISPLMDENTHLIGETKIDEASEDIMDTFEQMNELVRAHRRKHEG